MKKAVEYGPWRRLTPETIARLARWNSSCNRGNRRVIEFIHQDCAPSVGRTAVQLPDSSRRTPDIDVGTGAKLLLSMDQYIRSMVGDQVAPSFDAAFSRLVNDALDRDALKLSCGKPEPTQNGWCPWHIAEYPKAQQVHETKKSHESLIGMAREKNRVREFRRKHNEILGMALRPKERIKVEKRLASSREFGVPWVQNLDPLDDVYPGEREWSLYWENIETSLSRDNMKAPK